MKLLNVKEIKYFIKKVLIRTVLIFTFLSAQLAQARVWIKDPRTPWIEFKAHVTALGTPNISYAQKQLQKKRKQAEAFQLKDKLLQAQELYLSGEGEKANKIFREIIKPALAFEWGKEDQRIILYAFLRIAQSEKDTEKRKALLLSARDFAVFPINKKNYPDYNLFPPPLMEELNLIQKKTNKLLLSGKDIFPHHEILLINGQIFEKNKKIKIPQAVYRVTALSSSHQTWSQVLNLSKLLTQKIKTKSLTTGPCGKLQTQGVNENAQILAASKCPSLSPFSNEEQKQTELEKELAQKSASNWKDSSKTTSEWISEMSPWIAVGLGAVILSLVIALGGKDTKKQERNIF